MSALRNILMQLLLASTLAIAFFVVCQRHAEIQQHILSLSSHTPSPSASTGPDTRDERVTERPDPTVHVPTPSSALIDRANEIAALLSQHVESEDLSSLRPFSMSTQCVKGSDISYEEYASETHIPDVQPEHAELHALIQQEWLDVHQRSNLDLDHVATVSALVRGGSTRLPLYMRNALPAILKCKTTKRVVVSMWDMDSTAAFRLFKRSATNDALLSQYTCLNEHSLEQLPESPVVFTLEGHPMLVLAPTKTGLGDRFGVEHEFQKRRADGKIANPVSEFESLLGDVDYVANTDDDRWFSCSAMEAVVRAANTTRIQMPAKNAVTRPMGWRRHDDEVCGIYGTGKMVHALALAGAAFVPKRALDMYMRILPQRVRDLISRELNCEDIAFNYVVSLLHRDSRTYNFLDDGSASEANFGGRTLTQTNTWARRGSCVQLLTKVFEPFRARPKPHH
ncbi:MAG: hypothetical protein MHM6MM_007389 [Cercozoa sp. M6MM]